MSFERTKTELEAGKLYVHCPQCDGRQQVFAYTDLGDGFRPAQGTYFTCPTCSGTAEADAEKAREYIEKMSDDDDDDAADITMGR